jgi:hypothetical protein
MEDRIKQLVLLAAKHGASEYDFVEAKDLSKAKLLAKELEEKTGQRVVVAPQHGDDDTEFIVHAFPPGEKSKGLGWQSVSGVCLHDIHSSIDVALAAHPHDKVVSVAICTTEVRLPAMWEDIDISEWYDPKGGMAIVQVQVDNEIHLVCERI